MMYGFLLYVVPVIIAVTAVVVGAIGARFYVQEIQQAKEELTAPEPPS